MPRRKSNKINKEAADRAVNFIERLLTHTKGKWAGVPFQLAPWQRKQIREVFGTLRPDGLRQYRTVYDSTARKNGKSEKAAAVALYLLFGDGEAGAEIYSAAAEREQASIVFNVAVQMVRNQPALESRCKIIESQKRIVRPDTGSFYRAISADAYSKHGFNAHGIIFDELHTQPNRELWDVLTTSTGTRAQPLTWAITTAGYDMNSICREVYEYAKRVLSGEIKDPTFYASIYEVPEDYDWRDKRHWKLANPALDDFRSREEMEIAYRRALSSPAFQNTFRRLYLNQWTQQADRWMDLGKWDASAGLLKKHELKGRKCYAGLDLASTTDIAALVLVFPEDDGKFRVLPFFWIPEEGMRQRINRDRVPYDVWAREGLIRPTPGEIIDYDYIMHVIDEVAREYDLVEVAFDRWGATQMATKLDEKGLKVVPFGQGFSSMSGPTKELMNLVLSKRLVHGGNPVLRWMANNLVVKQDPAGNIKPDKAKSTARIDGIVALIMALDRALRNQEEGSVYDNPDEVVL